VTPIRPGMAPPSYIGEAAAAPVSVGNPVQRMEAIRGPGTEAAENAAAKAKQEAEYAAAKATQEAEYAASFRGRAENAAGRAADYAQQNPYKTVGGLGALGLGGAYAMGDADTTGNQLRNMSNQYLGTDLETQSRLSHALGLKTSEEKVAMPISWIPRLRNSIPKLKDAVIQNAAGVPEAASVADAGRTVLKDLGILGLGAAGAVGTAAGIGAGTVAGGAMLLPALGSMYALGDADTPVNHAKNLSNSVLGTDFETRSRIGNLFDEKLGSDGGRWGCDG